MLRDNSATLILDHNLKSKGQKEQQMQYPMRTGVGPDNLQITSPKVMKYIKMKGLAGTDGKISAKKSKDTTRDDDLNQERLKATLSKSREDSYSSLKKGETMTTQLRNGEMPITNYYQKNKNRLTIKETTSPT